MGWLEGILAWRRSLNYPLYIPDDLSELVRKPLVTGSQDEAVENCTRLARLGSPAARALSAYLSFRGVELPDMKQAQAEELCRAAAVGGHAYAQYVLAWTQWNKQAHSDAFAWICESAKQSFLPAIVDLGRFAANGIGVPADPVAAQVAYLRAMRRGHAAAPGTLLNLYRQGELGLSKKTIGTTLYPIALLWHALNSWIRPFSAAVFLHPPKSKRGLFKRHKRRTTD